MEGMPCACACGTMEGVPCACEMMGIPCACACGTMGGMTYDYATMGIPCACACATMGKPGYSAAMGKLSACETMAETVASPAKAVELVNVANKAYHAPSTKVSRVGVESTKYSQHNNETTRPPFPGTSITPREAVERDILMGKGLGEGLKVGLSRGLGEGLGIGVGLGLTQALKSAVKDCGKHDNSGNSNIKFTLAVTVSITISVSFSLGLTAYLLRPTTPSFSIQNANIYQFNLSSSADDFLLSSAMLVAVSSLNHNARVGVYYDRLDAHAAYMDQRITLPAALPAGYQGHNGVSVWSPYLFGATLPVTAPLVQALLQEQSAGYMRIHVNLHGKLRWKVGGWISGHYHLRVSCPALFSFQGAGGSSTTGAGGQYRFQQIAECSVDV